MNLFSLMAEISVNNKEYNEKIKESGGITNKVAGGMKNAIKDGALAMGISFAGVTASSLKFGMDFESAMDQVAATMGIVGDSSDENFSKLSKAAKDMGSSTKFSSTEAAEALNYLALAGYDTDKSISALPKVLNLAQAGGLDLAYASDLVTDSMSALGIQTDQLEGFVDELAKTSQKSNTNVAQLGEAILTVGGTAKVLKGGTVELNTQLGILADNGIKGAEGGTLLRNVILSLGSPTDKAGKLMKKLGLEVYDSSGKMRATNEIFKDLDRILGTMTEQEKTKVLSELFNKVDLKGVNALLANSSERFDQLSSAIDGSSGAASNMAKTMDDNLSGSVKGLLSKLEGFGIAIYEKIEEPVRKVVNFASTGIGKVIDALNSGKLDWLLDTIGVSLSAILGYMVAMKGVAIVTMIVEFASKLKTLISVLKGVTTAQELLNLAMISNPVGLLIGAIGALVAGLIYLYNTNEWFANGVNAIWDGIVTFISNAVESIKNFFTVTIPQAIDNMVTFFQELPTRIGEFLTQAINNVSTWANDMWNKAVEVGQNFVNGVIQFFQNLPQNVGFVLGYAFATVVKWGVDMWNKAIEVGQNFLNSIVTFFQQLPTNIYNFITNAYNSVTNWASNMWNKAKETGSNFLNSISNFFSQLPSTIANALSNAFNRVVNFGHQMGAKAREIGRNFSSWLIEAVSDLPSKFSNLGRNIVEGVWNGIKNMGSWLKSKVSSFFSGIVDGAKSALGIHSPSRVFAREVGRWIPAGVEVGIDKEMPSLQSSFEKQMQGLTDTAMDFPTNINYNLNDANNNNQSSLEAILIMLNKILQKDNGLYIDGKEVARGIAPYQSEFTSYNNMTSLAFR